MSDTDFTNPGPGPLHTAVAPAELTPAASGLVTTGMCRLAGSGPLAWLARVVARRITEAALTTGYCALHDSLPRPGGACQLPVAAGPPDVSAGIAVSWSTRTLLRMDGDRYGNHAGIQEAMNAAIGGVLRAFVYAARPFGAGGARLVTSHRHQGTGAGR